ASPTCPRWPVAPTTTWWRASGATARAWRAGSTSCRQGSGFRKSRGCWGAPPSPPRPSPTRRRCCACRRRLESLPESGLGGFHRFDVVHQAVGDHFIALALGVLAQHGFGLLRVALDVAG